MNPKNVQDNKLYSALDDFARPVWNFAEFTRTSRHPELPALTSVTIFEDVGTQKWSNQMTLLYTLLIGLVVGIIAKFFMPGRDPGGVIVTILLGIGGAILANFIGQGLNIYRDGEPAGFVAAVLGAMLILFIYRVMQRKAV
jgi:uncharacterized membrane protein YeaQ/YmgE (transglycosylase-associated protein family)